MNNEHGHYDPQQIEKKWQKNWSESGLYKFSNNDGKEKFYVLDMFPYISGSGLHVGHPKGYIATDVVARQKMLQGYSVLHPMGWDAFGLPAENYAIKNKINPNIFVHEHVQRFKQQLEMFGFTYDWNQEINTIDPEYYRWTQWIFLKMFERGLAFESEEPVNWCPGCKTVLANEDLEDGKCERCGTEVIQRKLRQWVLRMTDYADRLLYDLDTENLEWEDFIKEQQRNWIGRSEGTEFKFALENSEENIAVYTTRVDTVFGVTYVVIAPEHPLLEKLKSRIENYSEVEEYVLKAQNKTELERTDLQKDKKGVELKNIKAINPFTQEKIPVFVADYVLGFYGTGSVMAVPAHDERDFNFAKKYNLPIKKVIEGLEEKNDEAMVEDGTLVNSGEYTGLSSSEAREKMSQWLEKDGIGRKKINYKMRDWVFSRQRYWGEPIPIVHCAKCGAVGVPESELPLKLPLVENYEPSGTGESPLANISEWVNTTCPKCGGPARRETNTMPQWAGSSWYYLRYIDPKNNQKLVDSDLEKRWLPIDLYVGGAEHATRHLLYARFWHKFLYDLGVVTAKEPFKRLVHVGLILAQDGRKMSKRWGNVVNPEDIISEFGVDALRVYEMFMGPFSQSISWNTKGVVGARRFLDKVWKLQNKVVSESGDKKIAKLVNQTIKKVADDIDGFKFNTAISALMILANEFEKQEKISLADYQKLLIIFSPFAPHLCEEIWQNLGKQNSIFAQGWPEYDQALIDSLDDEIKIMIQINGKIRDEVMVPADADQKIVEKLSLEKEKISALLDGQSVKKIIYVSKKLINIVI
ncbi:MAG: leucine--tRNA ligase [Patescibacteria group bacterium]|nr:leucine--tRNA ligase [Patescibacteria group bacterium]